MTETPESILAMHILELPPIELEKEVDELNMQERAQVYQYLEAIVQRAALYTEYIEVRHMGNPHEDASKEATKRLVKVRRAMGYSYPERTGIRIP